MGVGLRVLITLVVVFVGFQLIPYGKQINPKYDKKDEIVVDKDLKSIFKRACYDCHSNDTKWPWYSYVAPVSWSVYDHVKGGRAALNFSTWNSYNDEQKAKLKSKIYRTVFKAMPLSEYVFIHKNATLSKDDIKKIRYWASDGNGYMPIEVR